MLNWALMFFVAALAAAALGVYGAMELSAHVGWLFAVIGTILLVVALVTHDGQRRGPPIL
jgi:uncharacterized membrane protein YtjA (UPF0391 family)